MIALGADTHKRSHTVVAVAAVTGELRDEKTVAVGMRGFDELLSWGRGLAEQRVWAIEDCRHVSGSFERFLVGRGERVVRVPTTLMAGERRGSRQRGKSDSIDAVAVARAAIREGVGELPMARLDGPSLICGCWSITANAWSASASRSTARCSGICTTSGPSSSCLAVRCSMAVGRRGSPGGSRGPSRQCESGSRVMSCAASASSARRSTRSRRTSPDRAAVARRARRRAVDDGQARR